jgi:hypothetical protein
MYPCAGNFLQLIDPFYRFQKGVRGAGLAYHTYLKVDEECGSIVFEVVRSPNCVKAVVAAGQIVRGLVDGTVSEAFDVNKRAQPPCLLRLTFRLEMQVPLDVNILDAARSSLAYTYANKERNVTTAVSNLRSSFLQLAAS